MSDDASFLGRYPLSDLEQTALAELCGTTPPTRTSNQAALVAHAAALAALEAPSLEPLRTALRRLIDDADLSVLLVTNCPPTADQAVLALLVCSLLGPVIRYAKEGDYVIAIKDDPAMHSTRPSFADAREFFGHTDLSYVVEPPPFFCLQSVHNNPTEGGLSVFCGVADIIPRLSKDNLAELQESQFLFPAPSHYVSGGDDVARFPILTHNDSGWHIRFRRDGLRSQSRAGITAVVDLIEAVNAASVEVMLEAGVIALISNQTALHGRTAFASSATSSEGRHINRVYVGADAVPPGATL
jgi:alpha-ketoglutarate-dependent taurine dioxygenase